MIRTTIFIEKYDWVVQCFISVTHYAADDIVDTIEGIGCTGKTLRDAERKLRAGEINAGLTYTSYRDRHSVMVTSLADSAAEQFNTTTHEIAHVCAHIANVVGIDPASEEFAYLVGDLSMAIFPKIRKLLCDCCRKKRHHGPQFN